jgi:hypothetical protein
MEERIMTNPNGYYDRDRNPRSADGSVHTAGTSAGTMNHAYSHHGNANEYISSGVPFVYTSAAFDASTVNVEKTINFPLVTRWVMVNVYSNANPTTLVNTAQVGFSLAGDGCSGIADTCSVSAYLCARQRLEIKCNQICVHIPSGSPSDVQIEVIAGLTGIRGTDFPDMDGLFVAGITDKDSDGSTTASNGTVTHKAFSIIS